MRKHGSALSMPAYDLGALVFGTASAAQGVRALNDQSLNEWQLAGLSMTLLLAAVFSYKAHRRPSKGN